MIFSLHPSRESFRGYDVWAAVIGYHAPVRNAIGLELVSLRRAGAREAAAQTVHDTRVARECLESV